jgi:serine/threonine protein kinase
VSDLFREHLVEALGTHYTLDRELTGGGMSRVFVAREHALNRTVVVKVLRQELAADVNRDRFRREIMLAAQLQHPLIVTVLSAGEHNELLWYTMPFIEGESLREEIRRGTPASARSAMRVLHDVLDALAYAHARGVVHRDIKPGNILRHGNHSLVTDFGVAKALSASLPTSGTTSAGIAIGTPAYMAPEQLAADPAANHRMDIYAVGLLVYELLTGTQAFAESSPQATMAAQLTRMPPDLAKARPDIPPPLSSLIMRMLAKNPDDRPQTAAAALEELDAIVTPTGVTAPRRAPSRRNVWFWGLAAAVLVVGAILAALATKEPKRTTQVAAGRPDSAATAAPQTPTGVKTLPPAPPALTGGRADSTKTGAPTTTKTTSTKTAPSSGSAKADTKVATKAAPAARTTTGATKTTSNVVRPTTPLLNRRVAVLPIRVGTTRESIAAAAQSIQDSLQRVLTNAGYTLATDSELLRIVTQLNTGGGQLRRAADAAGMGAIVNVEVTVRADEVTAIAQVVDVWRAQTASAREVADLDKPLDLMSIVRHVSRGLDRVSWRTRTDPKRVVLFAVENQTGIDTLAPVARQLEDSLRASVVRFGAAAVPLDSAAQATRDDTERRLFAIRRGAGAMIVAAIYRIRADSAMIRMSVRDMSEERSLPRIEMRFPLRDLTPMASRLSATLVEQLGQVNWGPRAQQ